MSEALTPSLSQSDSLALLNTACTTIEYYRAGLGQAIASYILTGAPATALADLEQQVTRQHKPLYPGSSRGGFPDELTNQHKKVEQALKEFLASESGAQPAIWVRLGRVMYAGHYYDYRSFSHMADRPDGWAAQMLAIVAEHYDAISRDILVTTLQEYQQDPMLLDTWLLENANRYYSPNGKLRKHLQNTTDWLTLSCNPDWQQSLKALHVSARATLAGLLGKQLQTEQGERAESFIAPLLQLSADSAKSVRQATLLEIPKLPGQALAEHLQRAWSSVNATTRLYWVNAAAEHPDCKPLLTQLLATETAPKVCEALQRLANHQQPADDTPFEWQIPVLETVELSKEVPAPWFRLLQQSLQQRIRYTESNIENQQRYIEQSDNPRPYEIQYLERAQETLVKLQAITDADLQQVINWLAKSEARPTNQLLDTIIRNASLSQQPDANLRHLFRLLGNHNQYWGFLRHQPDFPRLLSELSDFRQLVAIAAEEGIEPQSVEALLFSSDDLPDYLLELQLWPYLAEHESIIDDGLKGQCANTVRLDANDLIISSLRLLQCFPQLPVRWNNALYDLCLHESRYVRRAAFETIDVLGIDLPRVLGMLGSREKALRADIIQWLGRLGLEESQPALLQALKKEKDAPTQALIIDALQRSGYDISEFLTLELLQKEADAGLRKAPPKSMEWFPRAQLPTLTFSDGSPVPEPLLFWWVVLSVKLKQPEGNALLDSYLTLLSENSQKTLGHFLLSAFIHQDTRCPTDEEAHAIAEKGKAAQYQQYQRWASSTWGADYANKTEQDAYNELYRNSKGNLLGSAIKEKGLLALTKRGDSQQLLALIRPFMKEHYKRRSQIEAMLAAVGDSDDPAIIQFVLGIARRYRTASVQTLARRLIDNIASRNGWSADELADRTIQTAGLEQLHGPTEFDYGSRTLAIQLDDNFKLQLLNPDGKVIKALPQPRQDDDKEAISEAKKWFGNSKKELKQVVEQQQARLYEAMITDREWHSNDWLQYLHQHPVMNRLLQRLLWQVEIDGAWVSFRPTEDDEFINLDDDEVNVPDDSRIRLLSAAALAQQDAADVKAWQQHLKDYKIKPLFDQLGSVHIAFKLGQRKIDHYHGYMTDAFTVRGVLTKAGYERGHAEDGGWFGEYTKNFDSLGLKVIFTFSGNCLPEEQVSAAIYSMQVVKLSKRRCWYQQEDYIPLAELPANLLNAIAIDYEAVAAKATHDPDWEKKLPW
ncbi:DUF4132 domain-containing protein [Oceanobacter kriegii]|uniref:DUF4132 domain-containing protein n=1 Tax=Oceanobacter kriegii TaxID=64972 RepID=UPI00042455BB|nr:DUF4132 domain-containing protein [Oceanobacter kriegii]